jgi:hypothetical protein
MALQLAAAVRDARLNAVEATVGVSAVMKIRTGAQPANCAAADSGTVLATLPLPSDWMNAASGGAVAKAGTWQDTAADAAGTAGHFRIYDSGGSVCHVQGSAGATGSGADLILDNAVLALAQLVVVNSFSLTDGNS